MANLKVEANRELKKEFLSLNQAVKVTAGMWSNPSVKAWATKNKVVKADVTVANVVKHWHKAKVDNKLAYTVTVTVNGERVKETRVKTRFSTWDVLSSLAIMGKTK